MNTHSDWSQWQSEWQRQPVADTAALLRHVRRKRRRMLAVVTIEGIILAIAASQLGRLFLMPGVDVRWKVWVALAAVLLGATAYLEFRWRRGTWAAAGESVADLLRLTAHRARVGIRLAWAGIIGTAVLIVITLVAAAPWLAPARWEHDPGLQQLLLVQIAANGIVVLLTVAFGAAYIIHLRRRLRRVQRMLADYAG